MKFCPNFLNFKTDLSYGFLSQSSLPIIRLVCQRKRTHLTSVIAEADFFQIVPNFGNFLQNHLAEIFEHLIRKSPSILLFFIENSVVQ